MKHTKTKPIALDRTANRLEVVAPVAVPVAVVPKAKKVKKAKKAKK